MTHSKYLHLIQPNDQVENYHLRGENEEYYIISPRQRPHVNMHVMKNNAIIAGTGDEPYGGQALTPLQKIWVIQGRELTEEESVVPEKIEDIILSRLSQPTE